MKADFELGLVGVEFAEFEMSWGVCDPPKWWWCWSRASLVIAGCGVDGPPPSVDWGGPNGSVKLRVVDLFAGD